MEGRTVKQLPETFLHVKKEFQKNVNQFWVNKRDSEGKKIESNENLALLYSLLNELSEFFSNEMFKVGEQLLEKNTDEKDFNISLPEFGKKVSYVKEANWIEVGKMDRQDWEDYDIKCNRAYLESKKSN